MGTGTRCGAPRVIIGVLVKRNRETAVVVTKDISALPAVMTSREIVEILLACCVITYSGLLVGLRRSDKLTHVSRRTVSTAVSGEHKGS